MKALWLFWLIGDVLGLSRTRLTLRQRCRAFQAGVAAQRDHSSEKAIGLFLNAIEIEPTFLDPRYALIDAYQNEGKRVEAASAITQLLEIEPSASHYRLILAQMLLEEKQPDRALAQFSYFFKSDPYNADGLFGLALRSPATGYGRPRTEAIELGRKHHPQDERFKNAVRAASSDL